MNIKQYILRPDVISFIGVVITAIGAVWHGKRYKLIICIGTLIVASGALWASIETKKFEAELKAKNEEIKKLNSYMLSTITGGDSFCYLSLGSINSSTNNALMFAVSQGKYPLYEVQLRIVDLEEHEKIKEKYEGTEKDLSYEDLTKRIFFLLWGISPKIVLHG